MAYLFTYDTTIGKIGIQENKGMITHIHLDEKDFPSDCINEETVVLKEAGKQLVEYFEGKRKEFQLPLAPVGTDFMKKVWNALQAIPYGETRSYQQVAEAIGNKKACRAVGNANNRNPIAIVIPCHRVIGANGKLTGYYGGLEMKQQLLELEGNNR